MHEGYHKLLTNLRLMTLAQARSLLKAHFRLAKIYRVKGSGVPVGKSLRAKPGGGTTQKAGTAISVWIRER
jgi:beta-lactam-binding protein with PASTA domain